MTKKVLFVATVDRGHIIKFHIPYLKYFKENGYEVHVACAGNAEIPYCDKKYEITFEKYPYKLSNLRAYKELKAIIDKNEYSLIHCHTPVGGVVGRLASRDARKKGTKVLYTAHGFHFYKGAPLINWLFYYPVEKWLSKYTDCLITINEEDYRNAIKYSFKADSIKMVNGVGVDLHRFFACNDVEKKNLREKYNYSDSDFILIYTADLNYNKHQDLIIEAVNLLRNKIPNIKLLLVGEGSLTESYQNQVNKLRLDDIISFLGYRDDVPDLLKLSDIAVSASRREGLPVNVMEAMATGLPLVVTDCRGNRDLVRGRENGFIIGVNDVKEFVNSVIKLYESNELRKEQGKKGMKIIKEYSLDSLMLEMKKIYSSMITDSL